MNTAFFHDTTFIKNNGNYYTRGSMNQEKFQKYKNEFGDITAVIKVIDYNQENKGVLDEKNLVNNIKVKAVNKNYRNSFEIVREQMNNTDFAIIRMPSIIGIVACREARKRNIPYLIEMVGCPKEALWYHGGIKYKLAMPLITLINKIELSKSKFTIYVTKKFLQKRYPSRGENIACSDVEIQPNEDIVLKNRIDKINKLNTKQDKIKIGLIGSLDVKYKGHFTAIKTLNILINKYKNIELHCVGSGDNKFWKKIAKKYNVEKNIIFDGIIPHEKINSWFDNMDLYIIPSLTEGMPRALIEAMSRGCPCMGTNVGGIPELLDKDMIIRKNNYKKLAKKIINLIEEKDKMLYNANRNFETSKEYQIEILNEKRQKYYKKVLKNIDNN